MEPKLGRFAFWRKREAVASEPVPYPEITPEAAREELERFKAHYTMGKHPFTDADAATRVMGALRDLEIRVGNMVSMQEFYAQENKHIAFLPPIGRRIAVDVLKGLDSGHAAIRIQEAKMKYLAIYQDLGVNMNLHNMAYYARYRPRGPVPNPFEE